MKQKRTYYVDEDLLATFEKAVGDGERSKVISQLMENYVRQNPDDLDALREAIIAAAPSVNEFYRKTANSW